MRHQQFGEVSPEVGELDEGRFDQLVDESADRALALLADLTAATDERLRELARRLAGRILVDIARAGVARTMGVGRIQSRRGGIEGDLDLDASLETIAAARAAHTPTHADELVIRGWRRPDTALCLLVDPGRQVKDHTLRRTQSSRRYREPTKHRGGDPQCALVQCAHGVS